MKKGLLAILTAGTLAVGGGVFVASGTAFGSTICNSQMGGTIPGPVIVPSGAYCNLQGADVIGNVQVQAGGTLVIGSGSHIEGSVQATNPGINHTYDPGGPTGSGISPFSIAICTSTIDGPVQITGAQSAVIIGENGCQGPVIINANGTNSSVGVSLTGNAGPTYLDGNTITGSVAVNGNKGLTDISRNTISGSLNCTGNNPPPTGGSNTVTGSKNAQCASL